MRRVTRMIGARMPISRVSRKQAHEHRGAAHDRDRQQERHLAAGLVADPAEHDRAERTHRESGTERRQGAQQLRGRIAGEEDRRQERCQHGVQVEVVPLDDRADRGRPDDERDLVVIGLCLGTDPGRGCSRHDTSPPSSARASRRVVQRACRTRTLPDDAREWGGGGRSGMEPALESAHDDRRASCRRRRHRESPARGPHLPAVERVRGGLDPV